MADSDHQDAISISSLFPEPTESASDGESSPKRPQKRKLLPSTGAEGDSSSQSDDSSFNFAPRPLLPPCKCQLDALDPKPLFVPEDYPHLPIGVVNPYLFYSPNCHIARHRNHAGAPRPILPATQHICICKRPAWAFNALLFIFRACSHCQACPAKPLLKEYQIARQAYNALGGILEREE